MNTSFKIIVFLFMGIMNVVKSQDTIILKTQARVICRVTQIYSGRIEYLMMDDTARKKYYSYPKNEVLEIVYANGKRTQISDDSVSAATSGTDQNKEEQYRKGFSDGYQHYQPQKERLVGASVIILPFVALPGCIYLSFKKVSDHEILDYRYQNNKNEDYRQGYLAGASKRRRVAAWSTFGGIVGAGTAIGLLYSMGNGQ
ncbi:MAG: hypothetical protein FJ347_02235 [Sphingomonadales bacterium]|nr:hypothetical protein [Sphingomonadales bacterium]